MYKFCIYVNNLLVIHELYGNGDKSYGTLPKYIL